MSTQAKAIGKCREYTMENIIPIAKAMGLNCGSISEWRCEGRDRCCVARLFLRDTTCIFTLQIGILYQTKVGILPKSNLA